jgi:hypothetical protein
MKMDIDKNHRKRSLFLSFQALLKINFVIVIITLIGGTILSPLLLSQSRFSAYGVSAANPSTVASAAAAAATAAGAKQDAAAAGAGAAAAAAASGEPVPSIATAAASAITAHGGSKAAAAAAAAGAAAAAAGATPQDAAAAGAAAAAGRPSTDISAAAGGGAPGAAAASAAGVAMNSGVGSSPVSSVPQNTTVQQPSAAPLTQQAPQPTSPPPQPTPTQPSAAPLTQQAPQPTPTQPSAAPLTQQAPQPTPTQPSAAPLTQQAPEQQSSQGIPGLLPPEQQQQQQQASQSPSPTSTPVPSEGLTANGTINSLIYAPATKWIATGNWSMVVRNGNVNSFNTNMTWYNNNGTATHTHQLSNFRATEGKVAIKPDNSLSLKGMMDVGTNNRIVWKNVHATIDIKGGKTFSTSVNDNETNHHFAGQTIYGVVTSLNRCSDQPGPNMEVLPPCT